MGTIQPGQRLTDTQYQEMMQRLNNSLKYNNVDQTLKTNVEAVDGIVDGKKDGKIDEDEVQKYIETTNAYNIAHGIAQIAESDILIAIKKFDSFDLTLDSSGTYTTNQNIDTIRTGQRLNDTQHQEMMQRLNNSLKYDNVDQTLKTNVEAADGIVDGKKDGKIDDAEVQKYIETTNAYNVAQGIEQIAESDILIAIKQFDPFDLTLDSSGTDTTNQSENNNTELSNLSSLIKAANIINENSNGYLSEDEFYEQYGITKSEVRTIVYLANTESLSDIEFEAQFGISKSEVIEALEPISGTVNGEIDEWVEQGATGDCYFLSGINSLATTPKGREIIKDSIKLNDDGSVTVTFKGAGKSYTITQEEIMQHDTDYDEFEYDAYSNGDNDMLVLEIAFSKLRQEEYNNVIDGGYFDDVTKALTGKAAKFYTKESDIDEILENAKNNNNLALTFDLGSIGITHSAKQTNGEDFDWSYGSHGFSITEVTDDTVTFINPWDSSNPITMSLSEFKELNISYLSSVDLNDVDVDNIQPYQMNNNDSNDMMDFIVNTNVTRILNDSRLQNADNSIKLKFLNEIKSAILEGNGKINDISKLFDSFAISNNLNDNEIDSLFYLADYLITDWFPDSSQISENEIDTSKLGKDLVIINTVRYKSDEEYDTAANILEDGKSIDSITNEIINSNTARVLNTSDLKTFISSLDKNNDNIITDEEYANIGIKFIDSFINQLEE